MKKLNVRDFKLKKKKGEKIATISLYDFPTAQIAENAGMDLILVGDSLGMTVLGYNTTIPVTIEQCLHHCGAVVRGAPNTFIVGDMPFCSYQKSIESALTNAARFLQEGMVDAVKIEGGKAMAETIAAMVRCGIPVCAHIGLLPQRVYAEGGYKIVGRTDEESEQLMADAMAVRDAGAFAIVLEGVTIDAAKRITETIDIPTIGIASGIHCDGQIQVLHDILGLSNYCPRHAKKYVDLKKTINDTMSEYINEIKESKFPAPENSFK